MNCELTGCKERPAVNTICVGQNDFGVMKFKLVSIDIQPNNDQPIVESWSFFLALFSSVFLFSIHAHAYVWGERRKRRNAYKCRQYCIVLSVYQFVNLRYIICKKKNFFNRIFARSSFYLCVSAFILASSFWHTFLSHLYFEFEKVFFFCSVWFCFDNFNFSADFHWLATNPILHIKTIPLQPIYICDLI